MKLQCYNTQLKLNALFSSVKQSTQVKGRQLTLEQRYAAASRHSEKGYKDHKDGLPETMEMAIGMKVMVTRNVETNLDIIDGARASANSHITIFVLFMHYLCTIVLIVKKSQNSQFSRFIYYPYYSLYYFSTIYTIFPTISNYFYYLTCCHA